MIHLESFSKRQKIDLIEFLKWMIFLSKDEENGSLDIELFEQHLERYIQEVVEDE